jgi:flagellar biosynthesis protein FliP
LFGLLIILGLILLISFKPFIIYLMTGILTVIFAIELIRELIGLPKID